MALLPEFQDVIHRLTDPNSEVIIFPAQHIGIFLGTCDVFSEFPTSLMPACIEVLVRDIHVNDWQVIMCHAKPCCFVRQLGNTEIRFANGDLTLPGSIHFDYIWIEVTYDAPEYDQSGYRWFEDAANGFGIGGVAQSIITSGAVGDVAIG